jgi:hypothetical protein
MRPRVVAVLAKRFALPIMFYHERRTKVKQTGKKMV